MATRHDLVFGEPRFVPLRPGADVITIASNRLDQQAGGRRHIGGNYLNYYGGADNYLGAARPTS